MKAFVVYDPIDPSTVTIAEAIGRGLRLRDIDTSVSAFDQRPSQDIVDADLLIVGGRHGDADESALRTWIEDLPEGAGRAAATFDVRPEHGGFLSGSAAKGFEHRLEERGFQMAADPESFHVDDDGGLLEGEEPRAEAWAAEEGGLLEMVLEDPS